MISLVSGLLMAFMLMPLKKEILEPAGMDMWRKIRESVVKETRRTLRDIEESIKRECEEWNSIFSSP